MKLTPQQRANLDRLGEKDQQWREAKLNLKIEAKRYVEDRLARFALEREKAVWDCVQDGIPKRQIGIEGLKTTSPNAVNDIIERIVEVQEAAGVEFAPAPAAPKYSWGKVKANLMTPNGFHAYLRIEGDDHEYRGNPDIPGDKGYVFFRLPDGRWLPADYNDPGEAALAWAAENPPE